MDSRQLIPLLSMSVCIHNMSGLGVRDTLDLCCLIKRNQNKSIVF